MHSLALLSLSTAALAALVTPRQQIPSDCSDLHIFLAKGNNEPYPGRQGKLAGAICTGFDGSCEYEDIVFYNPVDSDYCNSVSEGVSNGLRQITEFNKRCPDSKIAITGYSQGAQVVGDILGGGGGTFFNECTTPSTTALDPNSDAGKKVVAAMIWGDVRHTTNQPFNKMSGASGTGLFPREGDSLANLKKWDSVFISNCVAEDPICAGGNDVEHHLDYFDLYTDEAAGWVLKMAKAADSSSNTSSASSSSTTATSSEASAISSEASPTSASTTVAASSSSASASRSSTAVINSASGSNATTSAAATQVTSFATAKASNTAAPSASVSTIATAGASIVGGSHLVLMVGVAAVLNFL